tara:strand:+ start:97704 stop:99845 length:2142 start_codon:yes stop_codon:yes gene_type:complete
MMSNKISSRVCVWMMVCLAGLSASVGIAQSESTDLHIPVPSEEPKPTQVSGTLVDAFAQVQKQEPMRRAGLKAAMLRQIQTVVPVVIIVEDAQSYLFAISNWEGMVRFPVLWDDGSSIAHEHIARFVRSFQPEHVLRLKDTSGPQWTGSREQKQQLVEDALGKALNEQQSDWKATLKGLNDSGVISPGMVVTDVIDTTWPAALALSAGRLQPISFVKKTSHSYQPLSSADADTLERAIERTAQATGHRWDTIGDDIDAITLAVNTGTMISTGRNGVQDKLATSDRIGRRESNGSGERWAYCGQIIGNEAQVTYQAMCALFLKIDQGFVWDGYDSSAPWNTYDGTAAAESLRSGGLAVELNDEPNNTMHSWKLRTVRPVGNIPADETADEKTDEESSKAVDAKTNSSSAGIFLMNSKGASNMFDLPGVVDGTGRPGHMPMLDVPFALHIVHSFSLQYPRNRDTVGGRLLERGVFVYAGSVDEPYLSAFVPTPNIARRLMGSLAFATAVRFDDGKVWKVAVLGDPLVTVGSPGTRIDGSMNVPGAIDLDQRSKTRLKEGDYLGAIEDLSLLGHDELVVRIAKALLKDKPESFDSKVAKAAIPSLYRQAEYVSMIDAFDRLGADGQDDELMKDMLWLSSPYLLARAGTDDDLRSRVQAMLRSNLRFKQTIQDAEDLALSMRNQSMSDAISVLESLRSSLSQNQQKVLDRAIKRVRR